MDRWIEREREREREREYSQIITLFSSHTYCISSRKQVWHSNPIFEFRKDLNNNTIQYNINRIEWKLIITRGDAFFHSYYWYYIMLSFPSLTLTSIHLKTFMHMHTHCSLSLGFISSSETWRCFAFDKLPSSRVYPSVIIPPMCWTVSILRP